MEVQLKRLKLGDTIKPIHSCDNDLISLRDSDKKHWNSLIGHIQRHRRSNYPAIKIGKLAILFIRTSDFTS